ncbi:unnamed protein product [Cuscuta campestris]|uniref:Uncharacterized protein n=1 Tax=Cuscuta campestris TaxID=132261 RepID=A0A484K5N2_9ASTE|nr:unnamed protein product [Cuscuta campestris]
MTIVLDNFFSNQTVIQEVRLINKKLFNPEAIKIILILFHFDQVTLVSKTGRIYVQLGTQRSGTRNQKLVLQIKKVNYLKVKSQQEVHWAHRRSQKY